MSDEVEVKVFGKYIVADPAICHGRFTFRGTRILVETVLDQIAEGLTWDAIVGEWRGRVTPEAIADAVMLARDAMIAGNDEWRRSSIARSSVAG